MSLPSRLLDGLVLEGGSDVWPIAWRPRAPRRFPDPAMRPLIRPEAWHLREPGRAP